MLASRRLAHHRAQLADAPALDAAGEHIPHAAEQVVRLVDEQGHIGAPVEDALDVYRRVKGIVVVADGQVGDLRQGQAELKGADVVPIRHPPDGFRRPVVLLHDLLNGRAVPQEMPLRPGAEVRVAHGLLGALLVLGVEGQRPQVQGLAMHPRHSLQGALALGGAGGEVIHLRGESLPQRLQRREQRCHAFARASGHTGKQPPLQPDGRVHLHRHVPLPGAVAIIGELQSVKRGIPRPPVTAQHPHPANVGQQQAVEPPAAFLGREQRVELPPQDALAIHIGHPDQHLRQRPLLAKHMPIAHRLRLMRRERLQRRLLVLPQLDLLDHRHLAIAKGIHAPGDV